MKRLFIAVTVASLATMLVSASAHASELAFDAAGNLFWADGPSIFKFTSDGEKSTFATGLNAPDLAFDSKGDLFASDFGQKSIFKFTPDGKKSTLATAIKVFDMVIDRSDNLYVSDGDSILKFTADGNKSTFTTVISVFGLVIDRSGNVYFSDGFISRPAAGWFGRRIQSCLHATRAAGDARTRLFSINCAATSGRS